MKHNPENLPRPFRQVSNFVRISVSSGIESLRYRGRSVPERFLIDTVYKGLGVLIPERLPTLKDPEKTSLMADILSYMIYRNEELDLSYSWQAGNASTGRILKEIVLPLLEERSNALTHPSRRSMMREEGIDTLLNSCDREIDLVEQVANDRFRKGDLESFTYQDAVQYRGVVNAIYTCTVLGALLGIESESLKNDASVATLRARLEPVQGELTYEKILEKYSWLMDDNPKQSAATSTKLEKVFGVMYDLSMAGQVDDDWFGRHIDKILGVPSIALVGLRENKNNRRKTRKQLLATRREYTSRLNQLHFARLGTFAAVRGHEVIQFLGHAQLGIMRRRGNKKGVSEMRILGLKKIPVYPRDGAYADGELQ